MSNVQPQDGKKSTTTEPSVNNGTEPSVVTHNAVKDDAHPPHFSNGFFDNVPHMVTARRVYVQVLAQRTAIVIGLIFCVFIIYWKALSASPHRALNGQIIDFDGDVIGKNVSQRLLSTSDWRISWKLHDKSEFPNAQSDVGRSLLEEKSWVTVTINPGATSRLLEATRTSNEAYDASQAISVFAVEARNENAYRIYIRPPVEDALQKIVHDMAIELASVYLVQPPSNVTSNLPAASRVLVRPIYYTLHNLRPYDFPVATAATFVGLIYLLILSFILMNSGILARDVSGIEKHLTTPALIKLRLASPILIYFVVSCFYSLLSSAFSLPFHRNFGHGGFVIFWILCWFGMTAVGLAIEALVTLLTPRYIQIFLILWIITNISVCLHPLDALPSWYTYGHAAPFYQISRGARTIIFRTKNELGMNFGILLVWITISCVTLPIAQWFRRRQQLSISKTQHTTRL